jgi:hypothetical protein
VSAANGREKTISDERRSSQTVNPIENKTSAGAGGLTNGREKPYLTQSSQSSLFKVKNLKSFFLVLLGALCGLE